MASATRCPQCDAPVAGQFCPACGRRVDSSAAATVPTPRIAAPATPPPSAAAFGGGPSEATGSQEPNRDPVLVPVLIASCVVVAVITAGVVAIVLSGRGETAAPSTSVPVVSTAPTPPTTVPTTAPPPQSTIAPTPAPPPVQTSIVYRDVPAPVLSGRSVGPEEDSPWIAVVKSISKAEASFAQAQAQVGNFPEPDYPRGIGVVDTDEWDLRPGYWAIAVYSFDTRDEVESQCKQWGLAYGTECYPRNPFTGER